MSASVSSGAAAPAAAGQLERLDLFRGKMSLRSRNEWLILAITIALAPIVAFIIGTLWHAVLGVSSVAVLVVGAMVYVTVARGAFLGSCVMITKTQFPDVFAVVERCAAKLNVPMPLVFLRDDIYVPVVALGFGEPYTLVISTHWLEHFTDDELTFMVGRELGHIAAGHTRMTSILSVNGRENILISLIFGAWLRRTEYTADRVGFLSSGSTDSAYSAIALCEFHHFARKVDLAAFAQQRAEIAGDSVLRLGEWLSASPYATNRMEAIRTFHHTPLAAYWLQRLAAQPDSRAPVVQHRSDDVRKQDCASLGRRIVALAIDVLLVSSLGQIVNVTVGNGGAAAVVPAAVASTYSDSESRSPLHARPTPAATVQPTPTSSRTSGSHFGTAPLINDLPLLILFAYSVILVAIVGQTFGMMIVSIRVTTRRFRRPSVWQVIWRYLIAVPLFPLSLLWPGFWRVQLQDRFSGTRLVGIERALQRVALPA